MLGSPPDLDNEAVIGAVRGVEGVADVHHVHLWQMEEHEAALDTHVVVEDTAWGRLEDVKRAIKARLKDEFGIGRPLHAGVRARGPRLRRRPDLRPWVGRSTSL